MNKNIKYYVFQQALLNDWTRSSILKYWDILEDQPVDKWEDALKKVISEMDWGDIPFIIDTYTKNQA